MVLTQRAILNPVSIERYKFPYHSGSHATEAANMEPFADEKFPYHYGSHATKLPFVNAAKESCFHTTMVLTQLGICTE